MVSKTQRITAAELARRKGVSEAAVCQAAKRGRITRGRDDLFDLSLQENAAYLRTTKRQQRQVHPPAGGKSRADPEQDAARSAGRRKRGQKSRAEVPEGGGPLEIDGETYGMAELRKLKAQADKEEQNNAIRRGELVERTAVKRIFARVYQIIASQVKTLSEKLGPDVAAALGLAEDSVPRVQELMSMDTLRALGGIKREFNAYLDEIGEEEIDTE